MKRSIRRERLKKTALIKKLRFVFFCALFVLAIGALFYWGGSQLYRFCLVHLTLTTTAKIGNLSTWYLGQGIILRNETVAKAPFSGTIIRLVPEGTKVRARTLVALLKVTPDLSNLPRSVNLYSSSAGFVCYHLDGWEGILAPSQWEQLDFSYLFKQIKVRREIASSPTVMTGEPVFKIIDNLVNPYFVLKIEQEEPFTLGPGEEVGLEWEAEGRGKGQVLHIKNQSDTRILVVEIVEGGSNLPCSRYLKVRVVDEKCTGIVIPAQALVGYRKGIGVITISLTGYKFKKVKIIGRAGDQVVVEGIFPGTEVVLNPGLVKRFAGE